MLKSKDVAGVAPMKITATELSPRQVDRLLAETDPEKLVSPLAVLLGFTVPLVVVAMSTGVPEDMLVDELTLDELSATWVAVEEVNDFLSRRLAATSGLDAGVEPGTTSAASPAG